MRSNAITLILGASLVLQAPAISQIDTITILHVNDTHSALATIGSRDGSLDGERGGIARAASFIGSVKMHAPSALLLHAGDVSIGDLFYSRYFAVAELQFMLGIGFDAMTLGNHEFDLGPASLQQMLDTAFAAGSFPVLSANAVLGDPAVQGLKKHIFAYTMKKVGARNVGVFGLTTPSTNVISNPAPVFLDTNIITIAAAIVDTLKKKGCDVVICLSHLGLSLDRTLAGRVPGMSLIVGGHDHYLLERAIPVTNPAGDTTWIVQANAFYLNVGLVRLRIEGKRLQLLEYAPVSIDRAIPKEPATEAVVNVMIADIESVYGPVFTRQIGTVAGFFKEVPDSLTAPGWKDTPIGNLVTDAYRAALGTQIAIQAGGSTAQPLYPGPIVAADLFRIVGYGYNTDNGLGYHLATFEMKGSDLLAGLEFGLSAIEEDDEYLLQVSGMTYRYAPRKQPFHRVDAKDVKIGSAALDPTAVYTIGANEFVPRFLSGIGIPYTKLHVFSGDTTEFQVLLGYALGALRPKPEGRVRAIPATSTDSGTWIPMDFQLNPNESLQH
jgi:5'-nucleotidase